MGLIALGLGLSGPGLGGLTPGIRILVLGLGIGLRERKNRVAGGLGLLATVVQ